MLYKIEAFLSQSFEEAKEFSAAHPVLMVFSFNIVRDYRVVSVWHLGSDLIICCISHLNRKRLRR